MLNPDGWGQVNREAYSLFKAREYRKAFALYLRAANAGILNPTPFPLYLRAALKSKPRKAFALYLRAANAGTLQPEPST